ncbi:hypothetical protein LWI29_000179 [Acer saccharum]|uniref:Uncharacterized protein n=1 Tax=Acer saccharum TaxID=4024 RepID=A0AA39S1Z4_ACESA|nr:hypothetical protein LWI29_000179 [Acer saccharum]
MSHLLGELRRLGDYLTDLGGDPDAEFDTEPEHYTPPPAYEPGPSSHPHPFDPAAEFQMMLPYSPTALIPYPTPLSVAKPTRDQSDLDAIDFETSLD